MVASAFIRHGGTGPAQGWWMKRTRVVVKRWYNLFRYIVRTRTESSEWPYNPTPFARPVKSQFFYVQRIYKTDRSSVHGRSFAEKSHDPAEFPTKPIRISSGSVHGLPIWALTLTFSREPRISKPNRFLFESRGLIELEEREKTGWKSVKIRGKNEIELLGSNDRTSPSLPR